MSSGFISCAPPTSRVVRADMTNWEERISSGRRSLDPYRARRPLPLRRAAARGRGSLGRCRLRVRLRAEPACSATLRRRRVGRCSRTSTKAPSASAARALAALEPRTLVADLSTDDGLAALDEAIGPTDGQRVAITSMETVEHLDRPMAFVQWLRDQAERRGADVVLSVPNDAFWAMENPFHKTMWGEGAFEELRRLLPDHLAAAQFPINGSYIAAGKQSGHTVDVVTDVSSARVPSHFLAAFGPRRDRLAPRSRRDADRPPRPAPLGAAARGGPGVPLRRVARAEPRRAGRTREGLLPPQRHRALWRHRGRHRARAPARRAPWVRRDARDDERRRPADGAPPVAGGVVRHARRGAQGPLRRRDRDAVAHLLRPVRRARRPVRVLRPEPRGSILRAGCARRARPCRDHAHAPRLVHH